WSSYCQSGLISFQSSTYVRKTAAGTSWCRISAPMDATTEQTESSTAASSLAIRVASMPWAFSQQRPLDTREFIEEAKRRGLQLDAASLRELYRVGLLAPFVTVTSRPVRPPAPIDSHE